MKTYRIFLASSNELAYERKEFIVFISEENKRLKKKNILLEVEYWEDMDDAVSTSSKQDDYEAYLRDSDICVVLFWTKMGKFTLREYSLAKKLFEDTGRPRIYVYEKTAKPDFAVSNESKKSKKQFLENLNKPGSEHFPSQFENKDALINRFKKSLEYLIEEALNRKPAHTLSTEMPGDPAFFIGRDDELKKIRERLNASTKLMLINAEGGIGKTSLAAKYWHNSLYDYEYNAWLFCDNGIVNELKNLAPKLGVDLSSLANEEDKIAALKAALQNIAHSFLLVLDNANTPEHIEEFNKTFRGMPWHVLITSRCKNVLNKEQEYPIEHLPPPFAKKLFREYYNEEGNEFDILLDNLLNAIGYNTLLTELFAKNMSELKMRGETLADVLKQLETKGLFLEKRSFKISTDYTGNVHKKAATVDDVINILYDFSKLKEEERYWLVNMAILPASQYDFVFLCDLFKQDKFEFNVLTILSDKGWLIKNDNGFRISPVIQQLVLVKHKNTLHDDCLALIESLNGKLENDGTFIKDLNAAAHYAVVTPFITKHLIDNPFYELFLLNNNAYVYFTSIGELEKALHSANNESVISKAIDHKNGLAVSYQNLGNIHRTMGNLEEALHYYQDYSKLEEELHTTYPQDVLYKNNLAISYQYLGDIYETMGNLKVALQYYRDYSKLEEELYIDYPQAILYKNNLAVSYEKLGIIYEAMGNLDEALKYYQNDTKLTEELHATYPQNVSFKFGLAVSYEKLGDIHKKMDKLEIAAKYYNDEKILFEELYISNPQNVLFKNGLAVSYIRLAGWFITAKKKQAIELYQKAQKLWQELVDAYPRYEEFKKNLNWVNNKLDKLGE